MSVVVVVVFVFVVVVVVAVAVAVAVAVIYSTICQVLLLPVAAGNFAEKIKNLTPFH